MKANYKLAYSVIVSLQIIPALCNTTYAKEPTDRPNILWIVCEDLSPMLGCYGDSQATTPILDNLASKGVLFTQAYSNAPVSGASRAGLITGMVAPAYGAHNFRTREAVPSFIATYPELFRASGYYCTNNNKTDYNSSIEFRKDEIWDECSGTAHWKNRPDGMPFMSVFNIMTTHEGQISSKGAREKYIKAGLIPSEPRNSPEDVSIPPYHPEIKEIKEDWAYLHDMVTLMDSQVGDYLKELEDAGVAENTIVLFYADHGGNLSRSKRFLYSGGTKVPMIAYFPEKWQHLSPVKAGESYDELVQFIDLPKTSLSLAGIEQPENMMGRVICGNEAEATHKTIHFHRDRMDARYDSSRAVTDGRFLLIRNFYPHRPQACETTYPYIVQQNWGAWREWYENQKEGDIDPIRSAFFLSKLSVELYDMENDPFQIDNLANNPKYKREFASLDKDLDKWMVEIKDMGLIPEALMEKLAGEGTKYPTIYDYAHSDDFPVENILKEAKLASSATPTSSPKHFLEKLNDNHPVVRYWALYGLRRCENKSEEVRSALQKIIEKDEFMANQIMAIEAAVLCGEDKEVMFGKFQERVMKINSTYTFLFAINILQSSHLADFYTLDNWKSLDAKYKAESATLDKMGTYSGRIIDEAIEIFPNKAYSELY